MNFLKIDEYIKVLCAKTNLSTSEIGRRLNRTPQAFSQKLKRGKFSIEELQDIAMVCGCEFECTFKLPNGEQLNIK